MLERESGLLAAHRVPPSGMGAKEKAEKLAPLLLMPNFAQRVERVV